MTGPREAKTLPMKIADAKKLWRLLKGFEGVLQNPDLIPLQKKDLLARCGTAASILERLIVG